MSDHLSDADRDALLDRELDPGAERAALDHLLACRACREAHGALLEVGTLARLPRAAALEPQPVRRRWPVALTAVAVVAAAILALSVALRPRVAPAAEDVVVVHSLIVTTTREANGLVSRDTRRIVPGGVLEHDRERIRPAAEGRVLMALRRTAPYGDTTR